MAVVTAVPRGWMRGVGLGSDRGGAGGVQVVDLGVGDSLRMVLIRVPVAGGGCAAVEVVARPGVLGRAREPDGITVRVTSDGVVQSVLFGQGGVFGNVVWAVVAVGRAIWCR